MRTIGGELMGKRDIIRMVAGLVLFAAAYALINSELLIHSILYRLAANDPSSAMIAVGSIIFQSFILLALVVFLPKRFFWTLLVLVGISTAINVTYSGILGEVIDASKIAWMMEESRQSLATAKQFSGAVIVSALKTLAVLVLLSVSRRFLRPATSSLFSRFGPTGRGVTVSAMIALGLFTVMPFSLGGPVASERNAFVYAIQIVTADPPPERMKVEVEPAIDRQIEKIVWLIDESVTHEAFSRLIKPKIANYGHVDLGEAAALSNCSTPANVALRSGVNVTKTDGATDLRAAPSIWKYARKAGYRTSLWDGQVSGPPQNMLLPSERALIDDYRSMAAGIETDRKMATAINAQLKSQDRKFLYAVLRGAHYQYTDHYPGGSTDQDSSLKDQYEKAVLHSKGGFFETLLKGVDLKTVAIVYTSDHGQNIERGVTPHCSVDPGLNELSIPMMLMLSPDRLESFQTPDNGMRSASQVFPTTLSWMGYSADYARSNYDNDLTQPSKRPIWFGRNVTPVKTGDMIEVSAVPKR